MAEFYIDHNVSRELGSLLRQAGHGARTVHGLGLDRAGDEIHLSLAARSNWTFITHNSDDFELLHAAWLRWTKDWNVEEQHAGILILGLPISPKEAAEEVLVLIAREERLTGSLLIWRRGRGWTRKAED